MEKPKKESKKKAVRVIPNKEERYKENGEDKIKTTYGNGTVIVSIL